MRILLTVFIALVASGTSLAFAQSAGANQESSTTDFFRYVSSVAAPVMKENCGNVVEDSAEYNGRIDAWLEENEQSIVRGRDFRRSKLPDATGPRYEEKKRQELTVALSQLTPRDLKRDCEKYLDQIGKFIM